jgi:NADH-quinone oxidoreductase subunit L
MGGLAPRMVTTTITMTIGAAGLAGLPFLAGFFSKDAILEAAFMGHRRVIWALLLIGAFLTAFYTARLIFLTFFGGPRMSKEVAHHVHESPRAMTWPLIVLAILTVVAGWAVGVPSEHGTRFARFLAPVFPMEEAHHGGVAAYILLVLSVVVVSAGVVLAWYMYMTRAVRPEEIGRASTPVHALLLNAWYVDWLYDRAFVRPLLALYHALTRFDLGVIDGLVNLTGRLVVGWSAATRRVQTGYIVNYALTMAAGAVVLVAFLLAR